MIYQRADITPEEAAARGYRRVSRKYGIVARIDRADWLEHMAACYRRAPADFYRRGEHGIDDKPCPSWCDSYRRVISRDAIQFDPPELALRVPSSLDEECYYVPQPGDGEVNR